MRSEAAKEIARKRDAPSAIAVVDPAGGLLTFELMDGVRPASAPSRRHELRRGTICSRRWLRGDVKCS
jgi:Haem-degrading